MSGHKPNVVSIPPGVTFLPALVESCLNGGLGPTFERTDRDFSRAIFYVPTRRAARALAHAFADALQPRAVLLPRIVPLGDPSDLEEQAILREEAFAEDAGALPPAVSALGRRLLLTRLTQTWARSDAARELEMAGDGFSLGRGFMDCYGLAGELARLIDEVTIEGADWSRLDGLVDGPFDTYWQKMLTFLQIAGKAWPDIVAERGLLDGAERQNRLLLAQARHLAAHPPGHPVIAAGSTGTVQATAALLATIARLPQGAVVLPGLDLGLDEKAWALVADDDGAAGGQPGHPQSALKRLLPRLGVTRADVRQIGNSPDSALTARQDILRCAALPAEATDTWPALQAALTPRMAEGLKGLAIIEAADEREEAAAIALALREVLEKDGITAALITPDRALAERVSAELRRWGVRADDSAGTALSRTPLAALALLILNAVRENFRPVSIVALLQNACLAGDADGSLAEARAALEIAGFRAQDAAAGLEGLSLVLDDAETRQAKHHAPLALRRITPEALARARALLARVVAALAPLAALREGTATLAACAEAHGAALEALAGDRASDGADGRGLATVLDALLVEGGDTPVTFADYAAVAEAEIAAAVVPPAEPLQGRIKIWGLLEARLMTADRIVLGGLNEGIWPPAPRQDMLFNRSMRMSMGLALPERRIGQSAHDFAMALGARECVISRARTVEGTPMVASRFLRRLEAFIGKDRAEALKAEGDSYCALARQLDAAPTMPPAARPNPMPPAAQQPLTCSVTDAAVLERDPYAFYARDILGLSPLDPIEAGPDARDRGNIIHDALAEFVEQSQMRWPADPLAELLAIGERAFAPYAGSETVAAFWWPMFEKAAGWFVGEMARRRALVARRFSETSGKLALTLEDGSLFILRGRGDLIELLQDGTLAITDYKTGRVPGTDEVRVGFEPQLTLMAVMAAAGAMANVPARPVSGLHYVKIKAEPKLTSITFPEDKPPLAETAQKHLANLVRLLSRLRRGEEGFLSRRRMHRTGDAGIYDHLARVKEWNAAGEPNGP